MKTWNVRTGPDTWHSVVADTEMDARLQIQKRLENAVRAHSEQLGRVSEWTAEFVPL